MFLKRVGKTILNQYLNYSILTQRSNHISDAQLLIMIGENDVNAWRDLYDKYSGAMYSIVWHLTHNNEVANKIFTEAFLQLKEKNILIKIHFALCPFLLRYTHNYASQYLKKSGINPVSNSKIFDSHLIHLLCTQCNSIKDLAFKLNIAEAAAVKDLRKEFLMIRNKTF